MSIIENFMQQNSFKSLFLGGRRKSEEEDGNDGFSKPIHQLSLIANAVVAQCSRILNLSTEELQLSFESEMPDDVKQPTCYARNLFMYCSYQALKILSQRSDYLADKDFRRLTFDMMLAWETPDIGSDSLLKEAASSSNPEIEEEDEDAGSLFYNSSTSMAVQVDNKRTVGPEAFARIAPSCPAVADVITVGYLFDALTSSSGGQLHFLIYDKYLASLDKVIKSVKSALGQSQASNLHLAEGEIIIDMDGTVPTQPVLQHVGFSVWPGRLTLTNRALYFESIGVGSYDKPVIYDLAKDLKQVIKPELTGLLGARLFDKAVMYLSESLSEPVYLEFPEMKASSRRDYWLSISREILHVHRFVRKFNLKAVQQDEALSRATLAIFQCHAAREAFHILPFYFKTLLPFGLSEQLIGGDMILETLSTCLKLLNTQCQRDDVADGASSKNAKLASVVTPLAYVTLARLGFLLPKETDMAEAAIPMVGYLNIGENNPLEMAVAHAKSNSIVAELAQATVDQVKVKGIERNIAVMKELLFPVVEPVRWLCFLASWSDPTKSTLFLVLTSYFIYRGWIKYIVPSCFVFLAALMLWHKHHNRGKPLEAFKVMPPPNANAVEQLIALQQAISQFEELIQDGNITLLKLRALLFAVCPQATNKVILLFIVMAAMFVFMHQKHILMLVFLEAFTREMPLRKESSNTLIRRIREWWSEIPAVPVQLVKSGENNSKKEK